MPSSALGTVLPTCQTAKVSGVALHLLSGQSRLLSAPGGRRERRLVTELLPLPGAQVTRASTGWH